MKRMLQINESWGHKKRKIPMIFNINWTQKQINNAVQKCINRLENNCQFYRILLVPKAGVLYKDEDDTIFSIILVEKI